MHDASVVVRSAAVGGEDVLKFSPISFSQVMPLGENHVLFNDLNIIIPARN